MTEKIQTKIGIIQLVGKQKIDGKFKKVNVSIQDREQAKELLSVGEWKNVRIFTEYRHKLPFIIRCWMARYGHIDIADMEGFGLVDEFNRPAIRRILNQL